MFQKVSKRKYSIMKLYCYSALEIWNSGRLHETQNELRFAMKKILVFIAGDFDLSLFLWNLRMRGCF